jgi:hypothetical protein
MPATTAADKVAVAFPAPIDREGAMKYAEWMQVTFAQIVTTARRTATGAVVLIVLFLLFVNAKSVDLTLGPAKVTNVAMVLVLIPAIVSFLLYELVVLIFAYWRFETVSAAFFSHCFPQLAQTDLDSLVGPSTPSVWGGEESWQLLRATDPGLLYDIRAYTGVGTMLALAVAMIAFLVLGYVHIDDHLHVNPVALWASVGFAALNVFRAMLLSVDEYLALKDL